MLAPQAANGDKPHRVVLVWRDWRPPRVAAGVQAGAAPPAGAAVTGMPPQAAAANLPPAPAAAAGEGAAGEGPMPEVREPFWQTA